MCYQSIIHIIGKWCLCSAVIAQAPATVSAVATNVGTATALASVTVPVFVANKKSSCSLCSCNSTSLSLLPLPLLLDLSQAPQAVHAQACCSACYRYDCSTPFLLLQVVDWHKMISVVCAYSINLQCVLYILEIYNTFYQSYIITCF